MVMTTKAIAAGREAGHQVAPTGSLDHGLCSCSVPKSRAVTTIRQRHALAMRPVTARPVRVNAEADRAVASNTTRLRDGVDRRVAHADDRHQYRFIKVQALPTNVPRKLMCPLLNGHE